MEIDDHKLNAAIRAAEALLAALTDLSSSGEWQDDSPEVKEKIAKRECLACGINVPDDDFYTRGLHKACYNTTMRRIRERRWDEDERIKEGKLSVRGKPGRPAAIDQAEAAVISRRETTKSKAAERKERAEKNVEAVKEAVSKLRSKKSD